ncbi:damage-inducible protein DinB [Mesorhizobium sanjuanii]|uniref:Damage-inducible protein DinB n=1 Tax=Mesorhizobium sanjuanii TaxID=2037900 RepID=A0A2A6FHA2_9HYPH|nr:DinB family protein [Mesorhizobium sanjuanii]PDQ21214.1 damage-inducible protein DinB [Mesorhizobium sanjuanii]
MSASILLRGLFAYQAWASDELLEKIASLDQHVHYEERHAAIRLINHCHVVALIFSAHLVGGSHSYDADNTADTPALAELRVAVAASDRWYRDYLEIVSPEQLSELVPFVFTDGDKGSMSRQEMLMHVALHASYHRGEIGRILVQLSITPPWDTFAAHLHQSEPSRRLQVEPLGAAYVHLDAQTAL